MPLPCSSCLLLNVGKDESDPFFVFYKMDGVYSRCGECARQGKSACDASGLDHSDCLFLALLSLLWLTLVLVVRLRQALLKAN